MKVNVDGVIYEVATPEAAEKSAASWLKSGEAWEADSPERAYNVKVAEAMLAAARKAREAAHR